VQRKMRNVALSFGRFPGFVQL